MLNILGKSSPFRRCEWVMLIVTNTKSRDFHFFFSISSITCWPFTYGILNMVELVQCLIILRFLPFLEYKFVNKRF